MRRCYSLLVLFPLLGVAVCADANKKKYIGDIDGKIIKKLNERNGIIDHSAGNAYQFSGDINKKIAKTGELLLEVTKKQREDEVDSKNPFHRSLHEIQKASELLDNVTQKEIKKIDKGSAVEAYKSAWHAEKRSNKILDILNRTD